MCIAYAIPLLSAYGVDVASGHTRDLTDLNAESKQKIADAGESYVFWSRLKFLEKMFNNDHMLVIIGVNFQPLMDDASCYTNALDRLCCCI